MMHTYENNTPQAWDDIRNHEALFESFASMYLREHPGDMLRLKREHTYKVLAHARAIVAQEGLASQEGRAALLAALYHDTGRFPQYVRWRTFSDAESENHGYLGVHVVKKEHFLTGEPQNIHKWVLTAIALHNRYALPALPEPYLTITHAVRDADSWTSCASWPSIFHGPFRRGTSFSVFRMPQNCGLNPLWILFFPVVSPVITIFVM